MRGNISRFKREHTVPEEASRYAVKYICEKVIVPHFSGIRFRIVSGRISNGVTKPHRNQEPPKVLLPRAKRASFQVGANNCSGDDDVSVVRALSVNNSPRKPSSSEEAK
jgi:hypothetical protein